MCVNAVKYSYGRGATSGTDTDSHFSHAIDKDTREKDITSARGCTQYMRAYMRGKIVSIKAQHVAGAGDTWQHAAG